MNTTTFPPTYLYIKQHSVTGKLYLGKSTRDEEGMLKYNGSGKYWKYHIKSHGIDKVTTLWYCLYVDQESLTEFAEKFSMQEDIINSESWANMRLENGIDGFPKGVKHAPWTEDRKQRKSDAMRGVVRGPMTNETKLNMSAHRSGKGLGPLSEEHKQAISTSLVGHKKPPRSKEHQEKLSGSFQSGKPSWNKGITGVTRKVNRVTCPHCNKTGHPGTMARYHYDKCKLKGNTNGTDSKNSN